jgi:hypothetical protein
MSETPNQERLRLRRLAIAQHDSQTDQQIATRRAGTPEAPGYDASVPPPPVERPPKPVKNDRVKLHEREVKERAPAYVLAERKKRREHITRRVNGAAFSDFIGFTPGKGDFPMKIVMGCGNEVIYDDLGDFPTSDDKCPCEDPYCNFVEYPKGVA